MSENSLSQPVCRERRPRQLPLVTITGPYLNTEHRAPSAPTAFSTISLPSVVGQHPPLLLPDQHEKKQKRNGFDVAPQATGYTPYSLSTRNRPARVAFTGNSETHQICPQQPLSEERWNQLALEAGILKAGSRLHPYQLDAANFILGRSGDLVVAAPTGMGKSVVWGLPPLVQKGCISLVIVPYATLGEQGEER